MKAARTIIFDANSLMGQPTGIGYYTAGLVAALAEANPDTRFVGYFYNFLGRKQPPRTPQAANIHYQPILHFPGPMVNLLRRFGVEVPVELLSLHRADFCLFPNFLSQPSLFRTPNAPIIHDLMFHDLPEHGSDKAVRDLQRFIPRVLKRADFIISVSGFTKRRLVDVYKVPASDIVTSFIPPVAIQPLPQEQVDKLVAKQGLSKPYLLFVGTLEPRKNLANLLDGYRLLPDKLRRQYSIVLAGKIDWKYHESKAKIEQLQAAGEDVRYLGYIDDDTRAALYQKARLMVLASHYEGFGMQILEAMQYGAPGAVSDIPVLHEVGGNMVSYFNQDDPAAIAKVIAACLEQPKPAAKDLQAYITSQPSWPEVAARVSQRITDTIERSKKGNS